MGASLAEHRLITVPLSGPSSVLLSTVSSLKYLGSFVPGWTELIIENNFSLFAERTSLSLASGH